MTDSPPRPAATPHRALVTGGAGFIGSHLVDRLLADGWSVRVLDDFSSGRRANLASALDSIDLVEGDIRDADTCARAAAHIDVVFHQAARGSVPRSIEDPIGSLEINFSGTLELLEAAAVAGVARFVYASSSSVYGSSDTLPKREGEEGEPLSPYAASKAAGEILATSYDRAFDLPTVGLRYFNVYGPRQDPRGPYAAVIPRFFAACLADRSMPIFGDGEQSRDFTFVADAVEANLLAAAAPSEACGRAYNVARGRAVTVNQLALAVARAAGVEPSIEHREPRPGDVRHSLADLTAVEGALGYTPRVDLDDGLALSREHYRSLDPETARPAEE